jgi:uncharacterized protein (DUF1697 family)
MNRTRYVALLGGINVGGHRVTMDRLRSLVTDLGHTNVATFIASGNVLFDADASRDGDELARTIAATLGDALGYAVPTYVRTADDIQRVAAMRPFGDIADGTTHMVAFCSAPISDSLSAELPGGERWHVQERELHWFIPGRLTSSAITLPKLVKTLGQPATTRNHTMLRKLAGYN